MKCLQRSEEVRKNLQDLDVVEAEKRQVSDENEDGGASRGIEEIRNEQRWGTDSQAVSVRWSQLLVPVVRCLLLVLVV